MSKINEVRLYDEANIDTLPWPDTEDARWIGPFLEHLVKNGIHHYVDNIETKMMILTVNDLILPITVNEGEYSNSYVCSPYGHYILYGLEYIQTMQNRVLKGLLTPLLKALGKIFQSCSLNKVVTINNWPFSTNLYPPMSEDEIVAIKNEMQKRYPQHAILFRSIHEYNGSGIYQALQRCSFNLIATRKIFFIPHENEEVFASRAFKSDLKLLRESNYTEVEETSREDSERIQTLYTKIYCDRHSDLNPQFNKRFISLVIDCHFPYMKVLQKDGRIDAVAGYFYRNGEMFAPFLGYDASMQSAKLYRLTCTVLTLEAKKRNLAFNLSAGAAFYKTIRKAEGALEWLAVYHKHLPFFRRFPWLLLRCIVNTIGIPVIRNYDK